MAKGSAGNHRPKLGKTRHHGANASDKKQADRELQAKLAAQRKDKGGKT